MTRTKTQKEKKEKKQKAKVKPKANLNVVLWLSFALFSVLLVLAFSITQNILISRVSREQVQENLIDAGKRLSSLFSSGNFNSTTDLTRSMLIVANQYNVSAYLFTGDGGYVYPEILESEQETFAEIFETVQEKLSAYTNADGEQYAVVFTTSSGDYAFATTVTLFNSQHYLYLSASLTTYYEFASAMRWFSIITALFALAVSLVLSGFISMLITKPLSEVTEKAKEMASGDYGVTFSEDYYCTEISDLSYALNYASSEISKADKMQKELIANVSHDFKTPLTMIKAYASMIQEISGDDPEKRQKHTQVIIDEADRLTMLVGDLLDLSKMRAGIEEMERTVFNLSEDVYRVTGRFGYLTDTQGYVIETDIDDDLYAYASRARIEQVLYNLIGNAVNYTGEDKKVLVRLKKQGDVSHFEVIDSGKGIAPEEIETIWDRYYRSSEAHKRPVQGTGLGLSIVKTILKKHNVAFGVQSEKGKGSCFWVDFPVPPEERTQS